MSLIDEMKALAGAPVDEEMTELETALGGLFEFCEDTGVELEAEDIEALLGEIDEWVANSDLSEEELAQLSEFAATVKRLAFKGGRAVGRVASAYKRAKAKVRAFGQGVRRSVRSGYAAGHKRTAPKRRQSVAAKRRTMGGPKRRPTAKQRAAAKKNMGAARKKRWKK